MSAVPRPIYPVPNHPEFHGSLADLENALRRDLDLLQYPLHNWVQPRRTGEGRSILDVLVIGGGQSGLVAAFGLMRERVTNILVIDENPAGQEGPWRTFARMKTLRTPKHLTGPDLGIANLTPRAWYEAQYGPGSWDHLSFLPKEVWADYLDWYRRFLRIPVCNEIKAGPIRWLPADNCFRVPGTTPEGPVEILARKIVLATGIDGSGRWAVPSEVERGLPRHLYAHTREPINFRSLRGRRVGVLGAGASAFDNASVALENGASQVHMFFRRPALNTVNPYRWAEFTGFLKHHADLPDPEKWRFVSELQRIGQLPPVDTYRRATGHANFHMHPGTTIHRYDPAPTGFIAWTPEGQMHLDFLIVATGFSTDLSQRDELRFLLPHAALWTDRYSPPPGEENEDLSRHPYLGPHFEMTEKNPGKAPWLRSVFNYTFGGLVSMGLGGASISGMKYSIPRLVSGITAQLYQEDAAHHLNTLCEYDIREL